MKKNLILLIAVCLLATPAFSGKAGNKLEEKKIKIETQYQKIVKRLESENEIPEIKELKLRHALETKNQRIKQLQDRYDMRAKHKKEREDLLEKIKIEHPEFFEQAEKEIKGGCQKTGKDKKDKKSKKGKKDKKSKKKLHKKSKIED